MLGSSKIQRQLSELPRSITHTRTKNKERVRDLMRLGNSLKFSRQKGEILLIKSPYRIRVQLPQYITRESTKKRITKKSEIGSKLKSWSNLKTGRTDLRSTGLHVMQSQPKQNNALRSIDRTIDRLHHVSCTVNWVVTAKPNYAYAALY